MSTRGNAGAITEKRLDLEHDESEVRNVHESIN